MANQGRTATSVRVKDSVYERGRVRRQPGEFRPPEKPVEMQIHDAIVRE
jgi:hypothetical protein